MGQAENLLEGRTVMFDRNPHDTGVIVRVSYGRLLIRWHVDGEIEQHRSDHPMIALVDA